MTAKKRNPGKTSQKKEPAEGNGNHDSMRVLGFLEKKLHETKGKTASSKNEMISAAEKELSPSWSKNIQTDYDQILEFVKERKKVKIKDIIRELKIPAERVEEKIKILEANDLVEVIYPAFGGAVITYKVKKEE